MRAAPVIHHSVNLIQNERARRAQHAAARFRRQQQIERFRRGDEDVRRSFGERLSLGGTGVTRTDFGADFDVAAFRFAELPADSLQRLFQGFADVIP